jgi:hypothetical protein
MSEKAKKIPGRTFFQYEDDDTVYVYSSLNEIVLTNDNKTKSDNLVYLHPSKHNKIYADRIALYGDLTLNARYSLTLFAREIRCPIGIRTVIRANGRHGADMVEHWRQETPAADRGHDGENRDGKPFHCTENTQDGGTGGDAKEPILPGTDGQKGGTIVIYAQTLSLKDAQSQLICEVRGGNGQQGQDGQGGGDGGDGFYRLYDRFLGATIYQSGYGGNGGNATYGGKGGDGGGGGAVQVRFSSIIAIGTDGLVPVGDKGFVATLAGGTKGLRGKPGKPGRGGRHSNNRDDRSCDALKYEVRRGNWHSGYWSETCWREWERRKENDGRDDLEVGRTQAVDGRLTGNEQPDGANGKDGAVSPLNPDTIVSATHLLMMLERAKADHLVASLQVDPASLADKKSANPFRKICELLDWIIERSRWAQSTTESGEAHRSLLDIDAFRDIHVTAQRLKSYAANRYSPFGKDLINPVIPNLSYALLDTALKGRIERLNKIKSEYDGVLKAGENYRDAQDAFNRRTNTNEAARQVFQKKKDECLAELPELAKRIEETRRTLAPMKEQLRQRVDDFKQAVTEFSLNWDDLVEAITMTVFEDSLAIVEGVDLLHKGLTEVTSDDGEKINKGMIVQQTIALKGDLEKSLSVGYNSRSGELKAGEGLELLLADLQEYDRLVKKFISYTKAKELHRLIQKFFQTASKLNDAIWQYNTVVLEIAQCNERLRSLNDEQGQTLASIASMNGPGVAYLTASLARRYSVALDECAQQISFLERAFRYCTLGQTSGAFHELFGVDMAWGENDDILHRLTPDTLEGCKNKLVDEYLTYLDNQSNKPSRFPEASDDPKLLLTLRPDASGTYPFVFREGEGYRLHFNIVRGRDDQLSDDDYYIPEIADGYDVRLVNEGHNGIKLHVTLEDGSVPETIWAVLEHGNVDTIYDKDGEPHRFRLKGYVNVAVMTTPTVAGPKLSAAESVSSMDTYRQIGPYSDWTLFLSVRTGTNPNLDPKKIRGLQLELSVTLRGRT